MSKEYKNAICRIGLRPFKGFVKGSGVPQFESFTIAHVADGVGD